MNRGKIYSDVFLLIISFYSIFSAAGGGFDFPCITRAEGDFLRRVKSAEVPDAGGGRYVTIGGIRLPFIGSPLAEEPERLTITPHVEKILFLIASVLRTEKQGWRIPVALVGESGVGKSTFVRYIAAEQGVPFYWIPMNRDITPQDLISGKPIKVQGEDGFIWIPGPIMRAIEEGGYVLLDDVNLAKPEVLKALHTILDMETEFADVISEDGQRKTIRINPNFRVFVAMNEDYLDRSPLGTAFPERFVRIDVGEYPREDLEMIVKDNLRPEFRGIIAPMLDLYYFMKSRYMGKEVHPSIRGRFTLETRGVLAPYEEYSYIGEEYYFGLRDLFAICDYLNEFYDPRETPATNFAYAAKYAFRDRLETLQEAEGADRYRSRSDFDYTLGNLLIEGQRPNMDKVLKYERMDMDEIFKLSMSRTLAGWIEYLLTENFSSTPLSGHLIAVSKLLNRGIVPLEIAAHLAVSHMPEMVAKKSIDGLVDIILNTGYTLLDRMRATEVLAELAENNAAARKSLQEIFETADLPTAVMVYSGASLVRYGAAPGAAITESLRESALFLITGEALIAESSHKEEITAKLISALGWLGIDNKRTDDMLVKMFDDGTSPIVRAKIAEIFAANGKHPVKIKNAFKRLATSSDTEERKTAALIALYALQGAAVNQEVKDGIVSLSLDADTEIRLIASEVALRLGIETEAVKERLLALYASAAMTTKLLAARILLDYGFLSEDDFLNTGMECLTIFGSLSKAEGYKVAYMTARVVGRILDKRISAQVGGYEAEINRLLTSFGDMDKLDIEIRSLLARFKLLDIAPQEGDRVPSLERFDLTVVPTFLAGLEMILPAIRLRHHIFIVGESGVSKSAIVKYVAALLKQQLGIMNLHGNKTATDLVGGFTIDRNGEIIWIPSELVEAVQGNYWILLEEMNAAKGSALERINTLLDRSGYMNVPEYKIGYRVQRGENSLIFATGNPVGSEPGVKAQSPALCNRFRVKWFNDYRKEEVIHIMQKRFKLSNDMATRLVELHASLVEAQEKGEIGNDRASEYTFSLRRLIHLGTLLLPLHIQDRAWATLSREERSAVRTLITGLGYSEFSVLPGEHTDRKFFEDRLRILFPE